ncbi:F0F1 ATP synthase subunit A [Marinobacter zhejiangensis]|uniref:ATP synthase subunit a n=1 Tax=Marinobacter zhejiangensis TaxID=488535 RepID=A0A1I4TFK8_9GAMM|nr:F0F1 ATP synthase subunit A [Marinobacter zhejiangensis]SFM75337.1 F-type H+-transporting ATPase subunit a [Marinobacter zhejiangensis]
MEDQGTSIPPVFSLGLVEVTNTVIVTWGILALTGVFCWLLSTRLRLTPSPLQVAIEGVVLAIEDAVSAVAPQHAREIMPFIGSLWIFLVIANLCGLIPGVHSPTRDLSATTALALLVFLSTHWFGIRIQGLKTYLQHYLSPSPILLPFHLISEITRTIALAVRLFGNMMSLEMAALLVLLVAGFLAPIPILMLHIVEALVQAYIFGMLALIYVAGSIQSHQLRYPPKE